MMVTNEHISSKEWVAAILALPNAPMIVKEVNDALQQERKLREHFYNEISEYEKAEFINGQVVIHSPVKKERNDVAGFLYQLMSAYVNKYKLGYLGYEKVMISLSRNDYEPDICYFNKEKSNKFKKGQSLFPEPDLVVEILSKKTSKNDRGIKFRDYEAHNILEYWIIDPNEEILEQYRLGQEGNYELILKAKEGVVHCEAIQGFNIPVEAIFDAEKNYETLTYIITKNP